MATNQNRTLEAQCQRIAIDIENNDRHDFDRMLEAFLLQINPVGMPGNLLPNILTAVLPICEELREFVIEYCKVLETDRTRCKPLLNLINNALLRLSSLNGGSGILNPYTFRSGNLDLLAHCNVSEAAQECDSDDGYDAQTPAQEQIPSLVFTSLPAALRVVGQNSGARLEAYLASDGPIKSPAQKFAWPDVLAAFELGAATRTNPLLSHLIPTLSLAGQRFHIFRMSETGLFSLRGSQDLSVTTWSSSTYSATSDCCTSSEIASGVPPAVQAALYGAKRMGCALSITYTITFLIVDDVLWIWRYDRQGAIQTDGLNFVQDLPRFLALLFAVQRFNLEDWGFHPILDPLPMQRHKILVREDISTRETAIVLNNGVEVTVDLTGRPQWDHRLEGRFTEVYNVSAVKTRSAHSPPLSDDKHYAVKIYWADMARLPEQAIMVRIEQEAHHPDVKNHIPYMLGWRDDDAFATNRIRDALSTLSSSSSTLVSRPAPSRTLRIIVFERLEKVQMLDGRGVMTVVLQCVKCHYALWRAGIRHNDLSTNNIMYRTIAGKICGVINDWDLATVPGSGHDGFEPAGTIPYMSLDLLTEEYWTHSPAAIKRLYRHDAESFVWIMAWLFLRYDKGKRIPCKDMDSWQTDDWYWCRVSKWDFACRPMSVTCRTPWNLEWMVTRSLVIWVRNMRIERNKSPSTEDMWLPSPLPTEEADEPEVVFRMFWERLWALTQAKTFPVQLCYLLDEIPAEYRAIFRKEGDS